MSQMGHSRRLNDVVAMSALLPTPDVSPQRSERREGPRATIQETASDRVKDLGFFIIDLASAVRVAVVDVVLHRGSHTTCLRDVFAWHAAMGGF